MIELRLDALPDGAALHSVTSRAATILGRAALCVELDAQTRAGALGADFGDKPTFVLVPVPFRNGTLEVDLLARLAPDAPDYARGFLGLAYRVRDGRFECLYLRPTNGRPLSPPPPRDGRALQYFAYPEWPYDRLRAERPDGGFEAGADIGPDRWMHLRLDVDGTTLTAQIDGAPVLHLPHTLAEPAAGGIGLWVDIGTQGFFAGLRITPRR